MRSRRRWAHRPIPAWRPRIGEDLRYRCGYHNCTDNREVLVVHANASLTPKGRWKLASSIVDDHWSIRRAAERFQVSPTTAKKWADRYRAGGDGRPVQPAPPQPRAHTETHRTPNRGAALHQPMGTAPHRLPPAPPAQHRLRGPDPHSGRRPTTGHRTDRAGANAAQTPPQHEGGDLRTRSSTPRARASVAPLLYRCRSLIMFSLTELLAQLAGTCRMRASPWPPPQGAAASVPSPRRCRSSRVIRCAITCRWGRSAVRAGANAVALAQQIGYSGTMQA